MAKVLKNKKGKFFYLWMLLSIVCMWAAMWGASGTMSPFTATSYSPIATQPCGYLDTDGYNQTSVFHMLNGVPRVHWEKAQMHRRILYTFLAFPFFKSYGFDIGGLYFN